MKITPREKGEPRVYDFSKAFDTVDHSILDRKLSHYGIRVIANDWFNYYLHNRRQYVSIGGTKSDDLVITHGVPQDSVLGPLLFLLYVDNFSNCSKLFGFHILQMIQFFFIPIAICLNWRSLLTL